MEAVLGRVGIWFFLLLMAVAGTAMARDTGYAASMTVIAVVAFVFLCATAARFDPLAKAQSLFRMPTDPSRYDDDPVRWGVIATVFWGVVGFSVGLIIALQLAFPALNFEPYYNFGRLRPLHTSGVVFAFGGNILIASSFCVVQRTCRARLAFPALARFVFWG